MDFPHLFSLQFLYCNKLVILQGGLCYVWNCTDPFFSGLQLPAGICFSFWSAGLWWSTVAYLLHQRRSRMWKIFLYEAACCCVWKSLSIDGTDSMLLRSRFSGCGHLSGMESLDCRCYCSSCAGTKVSRTFRKYPVLWRFSWSIKNKTLWRNHTSDFPDHFQKLLSGNRLSCCC